MITPKPVGSKTEQCYPPRKAFSDDFCSSFNVILPSGTDKTAATVASTLISLAADILVAAVFLSSSFSSETCKGSRGFLGSSQLKRKLIGYPWIMKTD